MLETHLTDFMTLADISGVISSQRVPDCFCCQIFWVDGLWRDCDSFFRKSWWTQYTLVAQNAEASACPVPTDKAGSWLVSDAAGKAFVLALETPEEQGADKVCPDAGT